MNAIVKKIALLLTLPALSAGFAGCSDDDADSVSSSEQKIVLEQTDTHRTFEIRSNTHWKAECIGLNHDNMEDEPWFTLTPTEGTGTTHVALDVISSNISSQTRKGNVVVRYANGQTYTIQVEQRGLTDILCGVTPERIGVGAKASTDNSFTVSVENRDAVITVTPDPEATWLTNLRKGYDLSYGYSRKEVWVFDAAENQHSDARSAEVKVRIEFSYNVYEYTVVVTQDGLGAPTIKTPASVYMNCGQTSHRQGIWIEGGDKTNVQYDVTWTSSFAGTGNAAGWITRAEVVGNELVVTADPNTDDAAREGAVMIVARRPSHAGKDACASLSVKVVQAGHKAAGIALPVAERTHPAPAAAYAQPVVLLNGSTVKSVTTTDNAMFAVLPTVENGSLAYSLAAYDGSRGDYREAVVSVIVSNGNSNDAIAALTIRQYAPEMPTIGTMLDQLVLSYEAQTGSLPLNPEQGTIITVVSKPAWITVPAVGADITALDYSVETFNGATSDDSREGIITLKASNAHVNDVYYYLTVRQHAAQVPTLNVPTYYGLGHEATTTLIPLNLQGGTILVDTSAPWLTTTATTDGISLAATANTAAAATNYKREALVVMKYTKDGRTSYYYINVCQYARDMAYTLTPNVSWSWDALCNGSSTFIDYGHYNPAKGTAYIIYLKNMPPYTKISLSQSNSTEFAQATINETDMYVKIVPSSWQLGTPDNTRVYSTTVHVTINAAPYVQTLTLTGKITVTSIHGQL